MIPSDPAGLHYLPRRPPTRGRCWPWLLGAGLLLLPYLALTAYAQPYWDDYDYATLVARLGSHDAVARYLYLHHSGRYGSFLLARLNPLAYGWPAGLPVVLAGLLLATGAVQAWGLRVLARQRLRWRWAATWSVLLLVGQLWAMPSPYSAFYWFSSAMVYQVPAVLNLLWPAAVLQSLRVACAWRRAAWYGLAAAAVLVVAGTNELALVLLGWCLGWLSWLAARRAQWAALRRWLGLAALALAAGVLVVAAPGNLERLHQPRLHPTAPLGQAVLQVLPLGLQFLADGRRLLALLALPLLLAPLGYRGRHLRPAELRLSVGQGLLLVGGGLAGQLLFLSLISWGYPASRTLNFMWVSLLFSWLLALWAMLPAPETPAPGWLAGPLRPAVLAACLLLGALGPEQAAWREWLGNARSWQRQLRAREAAIRQARRAGVRQLSVAPVRGVQPQYVLIIGETLSPDARAAYNGDMARWYGLDSLRLRQPGLPPADVRRY